MKIKCENCGKAGKMETYCDMCGTEVTGQTWIQKGEAVYCGPCWDISLEADSQLIVERHRGDFGTLIECECGAETAGTTHSKWCPKG